MDKTQEVLICNECKQFWSVLTKKCPDCGCQTLTKTNPYNARYIKDVSKIDIAIEFYNKENIKAKKALISLAKEDKVSDSFICHVAEKIKYNKQAIKILEELK